MTVNLFSEEERKTLPKDEESLDGNEILVFNCESVSSFREAEESVVHSARHR